ncbi:structural protein [Antarctic picorna-like virus 4]|uniref:structural protein n=1 Tax=Antarctic picorna-like virus 4 TaxID=1648484 RepID=UPI00067A7232|nr:structural protein [Antarctic picorna-like virus 4]AKG93966.1 structural protein [Antarctic picorna-like virus 4]
MSETDVSTVCYCPQSGLEGLNLGSSTPNSWLQTTQIEDGEGMMYQVESNTDPARVGGNESELLLEDFFERPVLISTVLWSQSTVLGITLNPWLEFFTDSRVINRISNFSRLRCDLHVKFVITGNGFFHGRVICSYLPLHNADQMTRRRALITTDNIARTQRPYVLLDPSLSAGAEMVLPFFWHYDALSIPLGDYIQMGEIDIAQLNPLRHANGGTGNVSISTFVWAENVKLSIPTTLNASGIGPQSGKSRKSGNVSSLSNGPDEYGRGIISRPASLLANIAGRLVTAPAIAPYARATQMAAGATSTLAQMFGYCRPVDLSPITRVRQEATSNLANVDASDQSVRLTLDSKQETTIDTRVMGLGGADEMGIKDITTRSTYLCTVPWSYTDVPGTRLLECPVTPSLYDILTAEPSVEYHLTSMCYVASLFSMWRGTIKFRFQVVASAYHRGKLRIMYDPIRFQGTPGYNTCYNYIVDIAEERDFTIEVGWGSTYGMLDCANYVGRSRPFELRGPDPLTSRPQEDNGTLRVEVFAETTLPSDLPTELEINVYVSTGDDIEFAVPTSLVINALTPFAPQSGSEPITPDMGDVAVDTIQDDKPVVMFATPPADTELALATFSGEVIVSLRTLLKRVVYHEFNSDIYVTANTRTITVTNRPVYPGFPGPDPLGNLVNVGSPVAVCSFHPMSWVMMAYTGWRGSVRVKCVDTGNIQRGHVMIGSKMTLGNYISSVRTFVAGSLFANARDNLAAYRNSFNGMHIAHPITNPNLEIEIPYQDKMRFKFCKRLDQRNNVTNDDFKFYTVARCGIPDPTTGFHALYAIGEDFQLGLYQGPPILYEAEY